MARVPAKKAAARKAAPAKKTTARRAAPARARRATPRPAAVAPTSTVTVDAAAPPPGGADLAGGLRSLLGAVESEVQAVSALSERIDELVRELNDARDEQARRLIVLDTLRGAVDDTNLGTFLDRAIRPRRTRVPEVVPERLSQG